MPLTPTAPAPLTPAHCGDPRCPTCPALCPHCDQPVNWAPDEVGDLWHCTDCDTWGDDGDIKPRDPDGCGCHCLPGCTCGCDHCHHQGQDA